MELSRIEIKSKEKGTPFTELYVDGKKVKGVRSLEFKHLPNTIPTLTVDLSAMDISIDCEMVMRQKGFEDEILTFTTINEEEILP